VRGARKRLPRLAGAAKAVEMCAFGAPVKSAGGARCRESSTGSSTAICVPVPWRSHARSTSQLARRTRDRQEKLANADPAIFFGPRAEQAAQENGEGQTAPLAAIDAVEATTKLEFAHGLKREAELFDQCLRSPAVQKRSFICFFSRRRAVTKIPGISSSHAYL